MARPITGTSRQVPNGHLRELPAAKGSKKRVRYVFSRKVDADRWLHAGIAALTDGLNPPFPEPRVLAARKTGTSFRAVAADWKRERFDLTGTAGASRIDTINRAIRIISEWTEAHDVSVETFDRKRVVEFLAELSKAPTRAESQVPAGLDPDRLVSMAEAVKLPGAPSLSTLKRRKHDGLLPVEVQADGHHRVRIRAVYSMAVGGGKKLKTGPRRKHGYAQDVLTDIRWVLESVFSYAHAIGINVPTDRGALPTPRTDRPNKAPRTAISLATCREIAVSMHTVHQLVLWLQRILGLRIGEAFGITVADVEDFGPGEPGLVAITSQGGRRFKVFDRSTGKVEKTNSKDSVKTGNSRRILVVPAALMDVLREVIRIFHTDETTGPRTAARLVPGLETANVGGQSSYRAALAAAARKAGLAEAATDEAEIDAMLSIGTHDLRKSVMTDLAMTDVPIEARRKFAGHQTGADVHHRHYIVDDARLRPLRAVAEELTKMIDTELNGRLMTTTSVRCTTGNQPALADDASRIDAELALLGWLVFPHDDGEPLLGSTEIAAELGCSARLVRKWMSKGQIPSVSMGSHGTGIERRVRISDVERVKKQLSAMTTVGSLAIELGRSPHTVHDYVRSKGLELEEIGKGRHLVPPKTELAVREYFDRLAAIETRSIPISAAAQELGCRIDVALRYIQRGQLQEDERGHGGTRMVTRASVAALCEARETPVGVPSAAL